jgi:hypothetical protein
MNRVELSIRLRLRSFGRPSDGAQDDSASLILSYEGLGR